MAIFGIRREKVKEIRAKRARETLEQRRKEERLARETRLVKAEAGLYEAKAKRKKAKDKASFQFPPLPTVKMKVKKKRMGRKLNRKRRIGLI